MRDVAPSQLLDDPDAALLAITRMHLAAYGPANRRDVAWWSGAGLRDVDRAIVELGDELTKRDGPDGVVYYDLAEPPGNGRGDPGVRLLPEYDALVVGYDPRTRDRFLDPEHVRYFWLMGNGSFSSVVLDRGRLTASWKLAGSATSRRIDVRMFPGQRPLAESDLADQVVALEAALEIQVAEISIAASTP